MLLCNCEFYHLLMVKFWWWVLPPLLMVNFTIFWTTFCPGPNTSFQLLQISQSKLPLLLVSLLHSGGCQGSLQTWYLDNLYSAQMLAQQCEDQASGELLQPVNAYIKDIKNGDFRVVSDLKWLNRSVVRCKFKMEIMRTILALQKNRYYLTCIFSSISNIKTIPHWKPHCHLKRTSKSGGTGWKRRNVGRNPK